VGPQVLALEDDGEEGLVGVEVLEDGADELLELRAEAVLRGRSQHGIEAREQLLPPRDDQLLEEGVAILEVVVQSPDGDACPRGDVFHASAVQAALAEYLLGSFEDRALRLSLETLSKRYNVASSW